MKSETKREGNHSICVMNEYMDMYFVSLMNVVLGTHIHNFFRRYVNSFHSIVQNLISDLYISFKLG